jgi:hypothetical protein
MSPLLVILLSLLAIGTGAAAARSARDRGGPSWRIKTMAKREITRLLERIAREEEPEFVMGAMCYAAIAIPSSAEYVCPVCGQKTLYADGDTWNIMWGITEARTLLDAVRESSGLDAALDETSYCSACRADSAVEPSLELVITWEDGSVHRSPVTVEDIRYMAGVVSGQLYYLTSNDSQSPLKPHLERLEQLFGVEVE